VIFFFLLICTWLWELNELSLSNDEMPVLTAVTTVAKNACRYRFQCNVRYTTIKDHTISHQCLQYLVTSRYCDILNFIKFWAQVKCLLLGSKEKNCLGNSSCCYCNMAFTAVLCDLAAWSNSSSGKLIGYITKMYTRYYLHNKRNIYGRTALDRLFSTKDKSHS